MSLMPANTGSESMSQRTGGLSRGSRFVPGQDGGQVEPEAVHVHLLHPVAEAVADQAADNRMISVQAVAGATVIGIRGPVRFQYIIRLVGQAPETQGRPMVPSRRMVEDHVQDYFDAGAMQGFYRSRN